jgi:Rod binding domain-containing protein
MSTSSTDITTASIGAAAGYPNLNVAEIPKNIQDGNSQAKRAYVEGLAFESVLVNELSQQMASTMYGTGSPYSSLIPQTLTTSIMDSGGLGTAEQFAQELDPSLAAGQSTDSGQSMAAGQ